MRHTQINRKKPQDAATLIDDVILIFKRVNFCFSPSEFLQCGTLQSPSDRSLRSLKFCQYQHKASSVKQKKQQGAVALRNDAILIFKLTNFCFSKSETRTLVRYLTNALRRKVYYQHKTHTNKQKKPHGAATFRDDAIIIFPPINF
jgi:hypothetical protein